MTSLNSVVTALKTVGLMAIVALLLGGCDSIELNGKIFDALGVSAASQQAAKREPVVPQRSGLVLPPDQQRLPEPGSAAGGEEAALAALNDPEKKKLAAAAEQARLHKLYCSGELQWKQKAFDRVTEGAPTSPYGPCTAIGGMLKQ